MIPLEISYRHMESSDALSERISSHAERLEKFYDHIIGCHVVISSSGKTNSHPAKEFAIRIDLKVPDRSISVHERLGAPLSQERISATINHTFHKLRRRLEDYARIRRGQVKFHNSQSEL